MTTSRSKAVGTAAERAIADVLGGHRVGQYGGPIDVIVGDYLSVQVKSLRALPGLKQLRKMLDAMPDERLRAAVILDRPGSGHLRKAWIVFDFDEWREWHG